ncbi:MAG: ABC transporter ATP-binding protein [Sarcina sp.]
MLELKNISFSYGNKQILKNVGFTANTGEFVGILGVNGCGKTTLLKSINKINKISSGEILLGGDNVLDLKGDKIAKKIAYVPQMLGESYEVNVTEFLMMGRKPYVSWGFSDSDIEIVENTMKELNIDHLAQKGFNELSGGQKQKILIARALVQEADVYLLDEPISFLDIKNQIEVLKILKKLANERNKIVIVVIHDLNMAIKFADKILLVKEGESFACGPTMDVLSSENIKSIYEVDVKVVENNIIPQI